MTEFYCRTHHTNNCLECAIENQTKQLIKANLDHSKSIIAAITRPATTEYLKKENGSNKLLKIAVVLSIAGLIAYIAWPLFE